MFDFGASHKHFQNFDHTFLETLKAGESLVSCALVTALLGWWQPIDSAPAATGATGATGQHWTS